MKNTPTPVKPQACEIMASSLRDIYDALLNAGDEIGPMYKLAISKLAILMRDQIAQAQSEGAAARGNPPVTPFERARDDRDFQRMKAKLVKKPRKNSKLWKEVV